MSGWAAGEFAFGQNIASVLASSPLIDRDLRNRLLQLLDKCADWDEDPAVSVDGAAVIDGLSVYGLGIARAAQLVATGRNVAVLTYAMAPPGRIPPSDHHGRPGRDFLPRR
ncbi:hypothetical protein [Candidatus Frankia alpina]|uniref:hypothetical protein n=1 Tax=Candidatus Frankia alpina TaxID=2699483 RepID=UPI0013866821|nr:hypothetical protein [Candidatus Frankia alpina]